MLLLMLLQLLWQVIDVAVDVVVVVMLVMVMVAGCGQDAGILQMLSQINTYMDKLKKCM